MFVVNKLNVRMLFYLIFGKTLKLGQTIIVDCFVKQKLSGLSLIFPFLKGASTHLVANLWLGKKDLEWLASEF